MIRIVVLEIVILISFIHRRCLRLASSIASIGIKKGDVVSVLAPNVPQMYESPTLVFEREREIGS